MGESSGVRDLGSSERSELLAAARAASERAYAPYSGVRVGAAIATADGRVVRGCNVENASFGLTLCAERSAVVAAIAEGARPPFRAIAVWSSLAEPILPCGACRQVLAEHSPDLVVVAGCGGGAVRERRLAELLPDAMGPRDLAGDRP